MDLGLSSPGVHRKHKAVSKGSGLCVVCGSHSGEWEQCAVGRQGSTARQGEASLKIWPGAPGTCERLVVWPGPAMLGGRQCPVLGRSQGDGSQFLVQAAMPG